MILLPQRNRRGENYLFINYCKNFFYVLYLTILSKLYFSITLICYPLPPPSNTYSDVNVIFTHFEDYGLSTFKLVLVRVCSSSTDTTIVFNLLNTSVLYGKWKRNHKTYLIITWSFHLTIKRRPSLGFEFFGFDTCS